MKHLPYLLLTILLIGCEADNTSVEELKIADSTFERENVEPLTTEIDDLTDYGFPFAAQQLDDKTYIFQGDILIDAREKVKIYEPGEIPDNKGVARTTGLWENGIVYYQFDPNLHPYAKNDALNAMRILEEEHNLSFVELASSKGYVYFINGSGCSSYIGRTGYRQDITLGSRNCGLGSTIHEILHAVGFWHEQSRADRNNYVKVLYENIQSGAEHNFALVTAYSYVPSVSLTEAYDFNSVMNYSSLAFSKNGQPTLVKLDGSTWTPNRAGLSPGDKEGIDKLYPGKTVEPVYVNGQTYVLYGLTVLRMNDAWWYNSKIYGLSKVVYRNNNWYYARN